MRKSAEWWAETMKGSPYNPDKKSWSFTKPNPRRTIGIKEKAMTKLQQAYKQLCTVQNLIETQGAAIHLANLHSLLVDSLANFATGLHEQQMQELTNSKTIKFEFTPRAKLWSEAWLTMGPVEECMPQDCDVWADKILEAFDKRFPEYKEMEKPSEPANVL